MTKKQEKELLDKFESHLKDARFQGMKIGASGILGAVLKMCDENKSIEDIRTFCKTSLNLDGMK
ncbi:hypothetical protein [Kineothrix sedimenti]|uniref:Uncharacterized protein n=1 Tax=Kineothrix sedimenti TaxID=3123317 RepID=A0ABZ3EZV0_9FIRM